MMTDRSVSQVVELPPQLAHIIQRTRNVGDLNPNISKTDISSLIGFQHEYDSSKSLKEQVSMFEKWIISQAIEQNGSITKAAKKLGIDRSTIIRKRNSY